MALTFDDGPSPSTPRLLELLQQLAIPATFFQVGVNVRRLPDITRTISDLGHELANHTDTHARLWLQSPSAVRLEIELAQSTILQAAGKAPKWFRAPYGVRWFGVAAAQRDLKLTGAMWTVIGLDWKLAAPAVADRLIHGAGNGAIFCLHDGRERLVNPDITSTLDAVREAVPRIRDAGFQFRTLSRLFGEHRVE